MGESLESNFIFPHPDTADRFGCVAVSREMNVPMLVEAYARGIFPWTDNPVGWFSPDPRAVFDLEQPKFPKRLLRLVRQKRFEVTFDQSFAEVLEACRASHQSNWITPRFVRAYNELHRIGLAHSVEVWQDGDLVGGLYGVQIAGLFAGESMFSKVSNTSKVALVHLVEHLVNLGGVLLDFQVLSPHTESLGAIDIPRAEFLKRVDEALTVCWQPGKWDNADSDDRVEE